jgi:hypothetical protein
MADSTSLGTIGEPNWPALLPVAQELERWTNASPTLAIDARDTWEEFKARQARSEAKLLRRLSRLPGCAVSSTPQGLVTTLLLAGVEVSSYDGLVGTCREWIARVRHEALRTAQSRA